MKNTLCFDLNNFNIDKFINEHPDVEMYNRIIKREKERIECISNEIGDLNPYDFFNQCAKNEYAEMPESFDKLSKILIKTNKIYKWYMEMINSLKRNIKEREDLIKIIKKEI